MYVVNSDLSCTLPYNKFLLEELLFTLYVAMNACMSDRGVALWHRSWCQSNFSGVRHEISDASAW